MTAPGADPADRRRPPGRAGRRGPKVPEQRRVHGRRFGDTAELYDQVRPDYPDAALETILSAAPVQPEQLQVCDLGAGTGLLTRRLQEASRVGELLAVDPDPQLLARNPAPGRLGTAEEIPLPDASVDLLTAAQAWHWFDPQAAPAEIARVLRPGGTLAIVLNQLDVRQPWVHRLARIMHAGDVYRPGWLPTLGEQFAPAVSSEHAFDDEVDIDSVIALAATRSYWLRSGPAVRSRVEANLREYLGDELGIAAGQRFALPYLCIVATAERVGPQD